MPDAEHLARQVFQSGPVAGPSMDLGSGPGRLTRMAIGRGWTNRPVYAVDISPAMLAQIPEDPQIIPTLIDGSTLPTTPPLAFGWSVLMFQHIPDVTKAGYLRQVAERLVPGGRFVVQWVESGDRAEYAHPTPAHLMIQYGEDAGLRLRTLWRDDLVSQWLWACWEKP